MSNEGDAAPTVQQQGDSGTSNPPPNTTPERPSDEQILNQQNLIR